MNLLQMYTKSYILYTYTPKFLLRRMKFAGVSEEWKSLFCPHGTPTNDG